MGDEPHYTIKNYPGDEPLWKRVESRKRLLFPYHHIAKIYGLDETGRKVSAGTAWRWEGHIAVTAGHVLAKAKAVECEFSDGEKALFAGAEDIHPEFFDNGAMRIGCPEDMAALKLSSGDRGGLQLREDFTPRNVTAVGFPGGSANMVEHSGAAWEAGDYFGHSAHTSHGHSGCPLLQDGLVAGFHIGAISVVARWRPRTTCPTPDGSNAGIKLRGKQLAFLKARAKSHGFSAI